MKNTDLKKERDRALYLAFKKGLGDGKFATMGDAVKYVCRHPAPRFFIEPEKASIIIGRILKGVSLINMNSNSRKMAWQLYRNYTEYLSAHPDCKLSRERIMEILVYQEAPEFYLEPQRTWKIINKERKKAREKWEKSLEPR